MDREKVIKGLECIAQKREPIANPCKDCGYSDILNYAICVKDVASDAITMLKEQETEIRQLRLALDIAKGTCKGIKSGGGQFADMPTMQSAT